MENPMKKLTKKVFISFLNENKTNMNVRVRLKEDNCLNKSDKGLKKPISPIDKKNNKVKLTILF